MSQTLTKRIKHIKSKPVYTEVTLYPEHSRLISETKGITIYCDKINLVENITINDIVIPYKILQLLKPIDKYLYVIPICTKYFQYNKCYWTFTYKCINKKIIEESCEALQISLYAPSISRYFYDVDVDMSLYPRILGFPNIKCMDIEYSKMDVYNIKNKDKIILGGLVTSGTKYMMMAICDNNMNTYDDIQSIVDYQTKVFIKRDFLTWSKQEYRSFLIPNVYILSDDILKHEWNGTSCSSQYVTDLILHKATINFTRSDKERELRIFYGIHTNLKVKAI